MEKLVIAGRTGRGEKGFYLKIKVKKKVLLILEKMLKELDPYFDLDDLIYPLKSLKNYKRWVDEWFPVTTKKYDLNVICGKKYIHLLFSKVPSYSSANKIIDKYCEWAKIKFKKKKK